MPADEQKGDRDELMAGSPHGAAEQDRTDPLAASGAYAERRSMIRQGTNASLERVELYREGSLSNTFLRLIVKDPGPVADAVRAALTSAPEQTTGFRDLLVDSDAALAAALEAPDCFLDAFRPGEMPQDPFLRATDLLAGTTQLAQLLARLEDEHQLYWANPQPGHIGLIREKDQLPGGHRHWRLLFYGWDALNNSPAEGPAGLIGAVTPAFTWLRSRAEDQSFTFGATVLSELLARLDRLQKQDGLDYQTLVQAVEQLRPELEPIAATSRGRVREHNEDACLVLELDQVSMVGAQLLLVAVADGMGGHQSGEVASSLALDLLRQQLSLAMLAPSTTAVDPAALPRQLETIIPGIGRALTERAALEPALSGMGTTLCGFCSVRPRSTTLPTAVPPDHAAVFSVGDSRAYVLAPAGLLPLSRDHSYVQQLVDEGSISAAEAHLHPHRNVITRCLGGNSSNPTPDVFEFTPGPGELLLIASDGLTDALRDDEIWEVVTAWDGVEPEQLASALIQAANDAGGPDNITVALVACSL